MAGRSGELVWTRSIGPWRTSMTDRLTIDVPSPAGGWGAPQPNVAEIEAVLSQQKRTGGGHRRPGGRPCGAPCRRETTRDGDDDDRGRHPRYVGTDLVRETCGGIRAAATEAFADLLGDSHFSAAEISFIQLIIDDLTANTAWVQQDADRCHGWVSTRARWIWIQRETVAAVSSGTLRAAR